MAVGDQNKLRQWRVKAQDVRSEASGKEVRAEEDLLGKRTQIPRTKAKEKRGFKQIRIEKSPYWQ